MNFLIKKFGDLKNQSYLCRRKLRDSINRKDEQINNVNVKNKNYEQN